MTAYGLFMPLARGLTGAARVRRTWDSTTVAWFIHMGVIPMLKLTPLYDDRSVNTVHVFCTAHLQKNKKQHFRAGSQVLAPHAWISRSMVKLLWAVRPFMQLFGL